MSGQSPAAPFVNAAPLIKQMAISPQYIHCFRVPTSAPLRRGRIGPACHSDPADGEQRWRS